MGIRGGIEIIEVESQCERRRGQGNHMPVLCIRTSNSLCNRYCNSTRYEVPIEYAYEYYLGKILKNLI